MKKELKEYVKHEFLVKNLLLGFSLIILIFLLVQLFLRIYTHHNHSIIVPDFTDMPVDVSSKLIKERHLRYEIFDSVFVASKQKGVVIDQHPKPGSIVKRHRKIYFTINANSPEKIRMPDIVGITLREARTKIDVAGLKVGRLIYRYNIAKNVVLELRYKGQTIEVGDTIFKGSPIDLILGKGLSDERTMVPNLVGLTVEQAKDRAADAFFTISTTIPDESDQENDTLIPRIYRQHPMRSKGVLVPLGSQITVWITTDSAKLNGKNNIDSLTYAIPEYKDAEHDESTEDDTYDYDYPD